MPYAFQLSTWRDVNVEPGRLPMMEREVIGSVIAVLVQGEAAPL
jgi:hypothetical protein